MTSRLSGYLAIIVASTLWGVAAAAAKFLFSSRAVPPFLLVQVRMGLSAVLLVVTLAIFAPKLLRLRRQDVSFFVIWGIVGMAAVQFTYLFTVAETNVATAIFLQYLAPVLTAAYMWLFQGEKPTGVLAICLTLALGGLFLLIFGGTEQLLVSTIGLMSGLASAVFCSFYTIYGARTPERISPWTLLCYGLGAGFLFWLVVDGVMLAVGSPPAGTALLGDLSMWPFFAYIAVLATIVPFGLYLTGLRTVSPTMANITGMLESVVGGLAAYIALHETLRPMQILGGCLIVAAVVLLQIKRQK